MYEGYLTEDKIAQILEKLGLPYQREWTLPGTRKRADYYIENEKLVIEFDGPRHFTTTATIFSDMEKDKILRALGITVWRIPYFLQPIRFNASSYLRAEILQNWEDPKYPQGFIDTKIYPYDFCSLGVADFNRYLYTGGMRWRQEVLQSLVDKNLPLNGLPPQLAKEYFPGINLPELANWL
jgi:very-short-patch-repair endonuclease